MTPIDENAQQLPQTPCSLTCVVALFFAQFTSTEVLAYASIGFEVGVVGFVGVTILLLLLITVELFLFVELLPGLNQSAAVFHQLLELLELELELEGLSHELPVSHTLAPVLHHELLVLLESHVSHQWLY